MERVNNSSNLLLPIFLHSENSNHSNNTIVIRPPPLFSAQVTSVAVFIFNNILGIPLVSAGIIANVFNIVVFTKQGFKETINISFTSLSVSDLAYLIHTLWQGMSMFSSLRNITWPFHFTEIVLVTGSIPRNYFSRVSSLITVYIAIERCISVLKPLQVRFIFTRKRLIFSVVGIYILNIVPFIPAYKTTRVAWKRDFLTNRTYLGVIYYREYLYIDNILMTIGIFLYFSTFIINALCAIILVSTLYKQSRWRGGTTAQSAGPRPRERTSDKNVKMPKEEGEEENIKSGDISLSLKTDDDKKKSGSTMSDRDKRAAKTVTFLAIMFVTCYLPGVIFQIVIIAMVEFSRTGRYMNAYLVFGLIALRAEGICASSNLLVYFNTSTKFRETMVQLLCAFRNKREKPSTSRGKE